MSWKSRIEACISSLGIPNLARMIGTFASPAAAEAHFAARLEFETDASDVRTAIEAGHPFVLIDARGDAAWAQGRIAGAVHMPTASIAERGAAEIPADALVVTYCWGPGCNGASRAALEFARLGFRVKEMIGGFEYWAREGLDVVDDAGHVHRDPDPLTAPIRTGAAIACDC